ncbi:PIM1 [[Candida] subhashii]|uniref:endopeptidase La n=1 Tax=[Candida] subhashii TaxID=561895 RepID=A0A8J5QML3_9ASCO|nr:PIM1 [[Candida] subhashii]KAG7665802.1 PIM1 [[Candida] subhashii]
MIRGRHTVRGLSRNLYKVNTSIPIRAASSVVWNGSNSSIKPRPFFLPSNTPTLKTIESFLLDEQPNLDKKDESVNKKEKPKKKETPKRKDKQEKDDKDIEKKKEDKDIEKSDVNDVRTSIDPNAPTSAGGNAPPSNNNNDGNDNKDKDPEYPIEEDSEREPRIKPNRDGEYPPLLAIPMKSRPPLPLRTTSISITDPEVIQAIKTISDKREAYFVLFHERDPDAVSTDVIESKESVHKTGVICEVIKFMEESSPKSMTIIAYPSARCELVDLSTPNMKGGRIEPEDFPTSYLMNKKVSYGTVREKKDLPYDPDSPEIKALIETMHTLLGTLGAQNPIQNLKTGEIPKDPAKFADYIASNVHAKPELIQEILDESNIPLRLRKALEILKVEVEALLIKQTAMSELNKKAEKAQIRGFIREFIAELQKGIGIKEGNRIAKYDERLKKLKLSEEAMEAYNAEKAKVLANLDHSSEIGVSEKYIDWLTSIPWGVYSKDSFNVKKARTILDRDHYGMKDVKERILQFISSGKVSGHVEGKILCLTGPPGTGKTSIARSIAEALNRKYVRLAVGGIQDVHEIKGHRRTYVGSVPGRIIYALKEAKTSNPLMLIDEIDKLDLSGRGGAASAFLEILDPEQNSEFVDTYIECRVDLSKVLFVCTANYLENVPAPLRDRMEIIEVSGYTKNEKIEIATKHLIPNASKKAQLENGHVIIPKETVSLINDKYCRESGMRYMKSLINRIFSKASLKIVEEIEAREEAEEAKKAEAEAKKQEETKEAEATTEEVKPEEEPKEEEVASADESKAKDDISKESEVTKSSSEAEKKVDEESKPEEAKTTTTDEVKQAEEEEEPHKLDIPADVVFEITPENLKDYIGPPVFEKDRLYDELVPGVATGLAFLNSGFGSVLYTESILTNSISSGSGHAGVHVTGRLMDVMKESASLAYSFVKSYMVKNFPENRFFEVADIHMHCPGGSIPKDGPSAGVAFTSSLISLALQKAMPANIAMTGEITVTGKVLAVGGLKEKLLGAKLYGCDTVIFPKSIENQLEEIDDEIKEGIKLIPIEWYDEAFEILFPGVTKEEGNKVWKEEFSKLEDKKKKKET